MSESNAPQKGKMQATERIVQQRGPMGGGQVGQKAMTFGPSARRLIGRMTPSRYAAGAVVVLAVASVFLMTLGPRLLGHATNVIVEGWVSARSGGPGIDFTRLGHKLELVLVVYVRPQGLLGRR